MFYSFASLKTNMNKEIYVYTGFVVTTEIDLGGKKISRVETN